MGTPGGVESTDFSDPWDILLGPSNIGGQMADGHPDEILPKKMHMPNFIWTNLEKFAEGQMGFPSENCRLQRRWMDIRSIYDK